MISIKTKSEEPFGCAQDRLRGKSDPDASSLIANRFSLIKFLRCDQGSIKSTPMMKRYTRK